MLKDKLKPYECEKQDELRRKAVRNSKLRTAIEQADNFRDQFVFVDSDALLLLASNTSSSNHHPDLMSIDEELRLINGGGGGGGANLTNGTIAESRDDKAATAMTISSNANVTSKDDKQAKSETNREVSDVCKETLPPLSIETTTTTIATSSNENNGPSAASPNAESSTMLSRVKKEQRSSAVKASASLQSLVSQRVPTQLQIQRRKINQLSGQDLVDYCERSKKHVGCFHSKRFESFTHSPLDTSRLFTLYTFA